MNIVTLQELTGHANIETTMEYLHLCQLDDRIPYFHVVFTLPDTLNTHALHQPNIIYDALFKAAKRQLHNKIALQNLPV